MDKFGILLQFIFVTAAAFVAFLYSGQGGTIIRKLLEISYGKPGCAPVGDVGNVTLHYFSGRGRAEAIRLLMQESGIHYDEVKFDKTSWPENKKKGIKSGLYTFGQVPAIETTNGVRLVQSHVIIHYLGRAVGMDCNCEEMHFCETVAAGVEDIRKPLSSLLYGSQYTLKDRELYLTESLPMWLGHLEKLAPSLSKQTEAYFASDRVTWVDFLVYDLLETNMEFATYDFGVPAMKNEELLEEYPKLKNFFVYFGGRPNIAKYRQSKKRAPFSIPKQPVELQSQKN